MRLNLEPASSLNGAASSLGSAPVVRTRPQAATGNALADDAFDVWLLILSFIARKLTKFHKFQNIITTYQ